MSCNIKKAVIMRREVLNIDAVVKKDTAAYMEAMEENKKDIREMVMDSYQDMLDGKGEDYKVFFTGLESRYRNTNA